MSNAEQLSADELEYHLVLSAQVQAAQAAWQSWAAHLARKYQLAQADEIGQDGRISRETGSAGQPAGVR